MKTVYRYNGKMFDTLREAQAECLWDNPRLLDDDMDDFFVDNIEEFYWEELGEMPIEKLMQYVYNIFVDSSSIKTEKRLNSRFSVLYETGSMTPHWINDNIQ